MRSLEEPRKGGSRYLYTVPKIITKSHQKGHLPSQSAMSTLQYYPKKATKFDSLKCWYEIALKSTSDNKKPGQISKLTTLWRDRTYPEEQRQKGSVKGHRYNARQPREQSIQKPMLIFLQKPTRPIPKRITLLRKKKTYIRREFNKNDHLGFHFQLQKLTETWIWRRRGFPVMTWWATHGCRKDLSLRVTLRYEDITIHATIPHSVVPCHTAILSISFSLFLSLSLSLWFPSWRRGIEEEKQWETQITQNGNKKKLKTSGRTWLWRHWGNFSPQRKEVLLLLFYFILV